MLLPVPPSISSHRTFKEFMDGRGVGLCMVASTSKNRMHIRIETPSESADDIAGATSIDVVQWEPLVRAIF